MKYVVIILLVLMPVALFAQFGTIPGQYERAKLVKTYTNFTGASDDTTGFIGGFPVDILNATEVVLVAVATDSAEADLNILGYNGNITNSSGTVQKVVTYVDSLKGAGAYTAAAPFVGTIPLKDATVNRLAGCTTFKIGTVFRATQGTLSGRTLKWYVYWRK